MKKILDFLLVCFYLVKNNFKLIYFSGTLLFIVISIFFIIDYKIWNKTGKSIYKKYMRL